MNCLFIGLGGAGTNAVATLQKMFHDYYAFEKAKTDIKKEFSDMLDDEFLYIDTDDAIIKVPEYKGVIKSADVINLGKVSPDAVIGLIEDKIKFKNESNNDLRVKEWFDNIRAKNDKTLENGADSVRMCSRINLFNECFLSGNDIQEKIKNKIIIIKKRQDTFNNKGGSKQPRIYIISGSCGGTGSGVFLDILYMINELYKSSIATTTDSVDIRPVIVMPQTFIDELQETDILNTNYKLNSYAFFNEINAVVRDYWNTENDTQFHHFYLKHPDSTVAQKPFKPYRVAYLFDAFSTKSDRNKATQKLANFLFNLELTAFNAAEGDNNSFDKSTTNSVDGIARASRQIQHVNSFVALGAFSIEKGDYIFKKYIKEKMIYEILKFGFKGETVFLTDKEKKSTVKEFDSLITEGLKKTIGIISNKIIDLNSHIKSLEDIKEGIIRLYNYDTVIAADHEEDEISKNIEEIKKSINEFISETEKLTYSYCQNKLLAYSLTHTTAFIDCLDTFYYNLIENNTKKAFDLNLEKAKKEKRISKSQVDKYINEFHNFLQEIIKQDLYVKLSDYGFLDNCKSFITTFNNKTIIDKKNEDWFTNFKKYLSDTEQDESRCILPAIGKIKNNNGDLIDGNILDEFYNKIVMRDPSDKHKPLLQFDDNDNKNTIYKIKKYIVDSISNFSSNFDPRAQIKYQAQFDLFAVELENEVNSIINTNEIVNDYFKKPITEFLKLGEIEKKDYENICNKFKTFDKVEFTSSTSAATGKIKHFVSMASFGGNTKLKADLEVGDNMTCKLIDNSYYSNKIVKLIVETGYNIRDYKFYGEQYEPFFKNHFFEKQMNFDHQPFIHKDFLGKDHNGDVWSVFQEKKEKSSNSSIKLASYSNEDVFRFLIFYLCGLFDTLKSNNNIESELLNGLVLKNELSLIPFKYDDLAETYIIEKEQKITIKDSYADNEIQNYNRFLSSWVNLLSEKLSKKPIANEYEVIQATHKLMIGKSIKTNLELLKEFIDTNGKLVKQDFLIHYKKRFTL